MQIEDFISKLGQNRLKFIYMKTNGELRYAYGTSNLSDIPEGAQPTGKVTNKSDDTKRYYDYNSNGWRSFKLDNIVWDQINGIYDNWFGNNDVLLEVRKLLNDN